MIEYVLKNLIVFLLLALWIAPVSLIAATQNSDFSLVDQHAALSREVWRIQTQKNPSLLKPLSGAQIDEIIDGSIQWLTRAQERSGHFKYEYAPYEDIYIQDDNIVRQAGALYALGEIAHRDTKGVYDLKTTMRRSIRYFESLSEEGEYNGKKFRCITDGSGNHVCKLGATSLALAGILGFVEGYPGYERTYQPLISDYVNFILAMKTETKGFRNLFNTAKTNQSDKESSFSNGEALLALVRYHQSHPDKRIKAVIDDTFEYLESEVPFDTALYLWAMAALKDLHQEDQREEYFKYVKAYTDWRIQSVSHLQNTSHNLCAYIEGIISAYSILASELNEPELMKYENEIDRWLSKSSQLQLGTQNKVRYTGETPSFIKIKDMEQALGGFLTGQSELTQRIDFTQHCVTSYVQKLVDIEETVFLKE